MVCLWRSALQGTPQVLCASISPPVTKGAPLGSPVLVLSYHLAVGPGPALVLAARDLGNTTPRCVSQFPRQTLRAHNLNWQVEARPCCPLGLQDLGGTLGLSASASPFVPGTIPRGSRGPRTLTPPPARVTVGGSPPGQALGARGWCGKALWRDLPTPLLGGCV